MSIEKLTKRLQDSIDFALDSEEDLDAASWNYQEGILITVNEAKLLLDIVKNCSIHNVVKSLPLQVFPNCTRVEVIDQKGRTYVNRNPTNKVRLSMQDEGRTAKIFID